MKKITNIIILVVMGISIVGGSIFASHIPIKWVEFGIFMAIIVGSIIVQRKITNKEMMSSATSKNSVENFIQYLKNLKSNSLKISELESDTPNSILVNQYEDTINNLLLEFDEFHLSLKHQLNISIYTSVLSLYGTAERYINRAYSAAIDDYSDESFKSIKTAISFLNETINELESLSK